MFFHLNGNYVIRIGTRQDRYPSMREFSNHAVLSMSDSTMAVSSKYKQDLFFSDPFSCKWFLCFYFWAVIWSYIVDLFAALHELASASARTIPFSSPEAALLLVSTKNHDLWPGPTPEVRDSRTSRHSAHAQS